AVAVCFSFSVFASPRDLLSFPTRRSSDLQRHIGGIIRKRGVVDQPPFLADPVHDVVAGVDAERAGDAFELLAVPYVDAHGTDGHAGVAIDAIADAFARRKRPLGMTRAGLAAP